MLTNAMWLYLFGQDSTTYFGLALIDIIVMLISGLAITNISTHNHLNNWAENIFFRGGMSIYAGWLTTATILNACFFLKSLGIDADNVKNEIMWSKIILSVAFVIYNAYAAIERNPLFGAVFVWVLLAIKDNHRDLPEITDFIDVLLPTHIISDLSIAAYSYFEYRTGTVTHGLFY